MGWTLIAPSPVEAKWTQSFDCLELPLCGQIVLVLLTLHGISLCHGMALSSTQSLRWGWTQSPQDLAVGSHAHGSGQRTADHRTRHCALFLHVLWLPSSVCSRGDGQGDGLLQRSQGQQEHPIPFQREVRRAPSNQETHITTWPPILHSEVDLFGAQASGILHGFSDHKTVTPTKKTKSVCLHQQFSQNTNA